MNFLVGQTSVHMRELLEPGLRHAPPESHRMKTDARPIRLLAACLPLALAACAATAPPPHVEAPTPAAWQAPLPHQGSLGDLAQWWAQWGDPLLVDLIREAQSLSPSVARSEERRVGKECR